MAFDADSHAALAALIDYAKQAGADASEASLAVRESISAEVRMGDLEGSRILAAQAGEVEMDAPQQRGAIRAAAGAGGPEGVDLVAHIAR